MDILLVVIIAFLVWPGSLLIYGYLSETKKLHGHTVKYCKNQKCKYLENIRRKSIYGYYAYEYRCGCQACKMDGSYDVYVNNKKQTYNRKLNELTRLFENKSDYNSFIQSEDNNLFLYELNEEDIFHLIMKNIQKEEQIKALLIKIINSSYISSLIIKLIRTNNILINKYILFIIDNVNKSGNRIYHKDIEEYIISSLEVLNFNLAENICKYIEKPMTDSFVDSLLKVFIDYSKENKKNLDIFLSNSKINFTISYENYIMLNNKISEILVFFKKYVSNYCVEKVIENALASNNISELEKISVIEDDFDSFINKNPNIVFTSLKNKQFEILEWLKKRNIIFDMKNEEGITPLMYTLVHRNNELFNWLLDCKMNINCLDKYGDTVLVYLCYRGRFKMAKLLYDNYGARLFAKTDENIYSSDTEKFLEDKLYESFKQNKKDMMPYIPCTYYILKKTKK